jgi:Prokaryotic cytochrome b561
MRLRNTPESWGAVANVLHWLGAALILAMLGLGLIMVHAGIASGQKFEAYQLHKSTGVLVLVVTLARGLWRGANSSAPGWHEAMGPHPGDDCIGMANGFGLTAAYSNTSSARLHLTQPDRPECAHRGASEIHS